MLISAFETRLRDLGWVLGQSLAIEYRWAEGDLSRFPVLVDELVRLKPDLMLAGNNQAALAMKQATAVIPIVAPTLFDPIGLGLIASLARPGGNVTGITSQDTLPEKNLELAVEAIRGAVKIGVLFNPAFQGHVIRRKAVEDAAMARAINVVSAEARLPADLDAAFQSMARQHVDCVIVLGEPMFFVERRRIATLAIEARLPTMFVARAHVEAGGLMSYGGNLNANFQHAADYVDKILGGSEASGSPGGTADEAGPRCQHQDRKGNRSYDLGSVPTPRRRGDRIKRSTSVFGVRRDKAALSSGCKPHPATAPAGSNRSSHGGNEVAEAFD